MLVEGLDSLRTRTHVMQPSIVKLAKQGDPQAIADLFNYFLHGDGMNAKVLLSHSLVEVIVESSSIPNKEQAVALIRQVIEYAPLDFIKQVKIYGKQSGMAKLAWFEEFTPNPQLSLPSENASNRTISPAESAVSQLVNSPEYCRDKARKELALMMGGGAVVGAVPVPGAFTAGTTAVQIAMVTRLAKIYGFSLEAAGGAAAVAGAIMVFGGANTLSKIAGEASTFIPFVGWLAKPAIAAAATKAFGEAAIAYFESHYPNKIYNPAEDK